MSANSTTAGNSVTASTVTGTSAGTPSAISTGGTSDTQLVSLSGIEGLLDRNHDLRVPISPNSPVDIVGGGVKLPDGVEQLLFVAKP